MYESSKKGISDLIYENTKTKSAEPEELDDDLVNFWATSLGDAPAMNRVSAIQMYWSLDTQELHLSTTTTKRIASKYKLGNPGSFLSDNRFTFFGLASHYS